MRLSQDGIPHPMNPDSFKESADDRIDRALEGLLTEAEWEQFQQDLLGDDALRTAYVEQRWLHSQLRTDHDILASLAADETASHGRRAWPGWTAAAAVALLALLSFLLIPREAQSVTVATLLEANGCRWEGSDLPTREGAKLGTGTLALAEGMATIQFDSGATVTLEAPTILQVDSAMRCRLIEGSVVADVPDSAHGFTIDTEKLEVIDLGTRFGVTSTPVGGSHVFVFEGEVKVREEEAEEAQHVLTGSSLHFGQTPGTPDEEVIRNRPQTSPGADWKPITTGTGRGKDAYLRREDGSGQTGADPLIMVKHTDLAPGNERRALLGFDLRSLDRSRVTAARLALQIESSGLGFSSLVPDSTFAVYGVLDPAIQDWKESVVLWENSPEFTQELLSEDRFRRLASFEIERGASNTVVEVESEELTAFLTSLKKPYANLMLVRETGEFDKQGLVHAFASKEHPTSPAPTLWFQLRP